MAPRGHGAPDYRAILDACLLTASVGLGLGVVALAGLLPGVALVGGALAVAPWLSAMGRKETLVIGSAEFVSATAKSAPQRRRVSALPLDGSDVNNATTVAAIALPDGTDLVMDAASFDVVRRLAPQWVGGDRVVRVVRTGLANPVLAPRRWAGAYAKRALDIVVAAVVLAVATPVLLVCMVAIKLETRGPALFRQDRLGLGGRRFRCYKLRTMRVDEDPGARLELIAAMIQCRALPVNGVFKPGSTDRVTRVGRVLRRFSIDELPQFANVLRGDMSVVGPRPPVLDEAQYYDGQAWQRLQGKPGLTGLAQISGRSSLTFDEIVALDVEYLESRSLLLELKILLRTPSAVFSARDAA